MTDTPLRLQLSRRKGLKLPEGAVNVARPSKWGNPYRVGTCMIPSTAAAVAAFIANLPLRPDLSELRGKSLACWCRLPEPGQPDICHAAVLLAIVNDDTDTLRAIGRAVGLKCEEVHHG